MPEIFATEKKNKKEAYQPFFPQKTDTLSYFKPVLYKQLLLQQ